MISRSVRFFLTAALVAFVPACASAGEGEELEGLWKEAEVDALLDLEGQVADEEHDPRVGLGDGRRLHRRGR